MKFGWTVRVEEKLLLQPLKPLGRLSFLMLLSQFLKEPGISKPLENALCIHPVLRIFLKQVTDQLSNRPFIAIWQILEVMI